MEEASIAAVNGELSPFTTGVTACSDDQRLPRPDGLPAGERVDRGDREILRTASRCRASPASAGSTGPRWPPSVAHGSAPSRSSSRRRPNSAPTTPTPPQADGLLRDRRHPPAPVATSRAPRRPSARRTPAAGRRSRRSLSSAWPRARSRRRSAAINAAVAEQTVGPLGPGPAPARPRSRSRSRPAISRLARAAVDAARRRSSPAIPSPALEAGRAGRARRGSSARPRAMRTAAVQELRGRDHGLARGRLAVRGRPSAGTSWRARSGRLDDEDDADLELARRARRVPAARRPDSTSRRVERELRDAEDRRSGPGDRPQDVHVHRHRRLDEPGRGARRRRRGSDSCAGTTTCSGALVDERGRGGRQLDRRRLLRGVRVGPGGASTAAIAIQRRSARAPGERPASRSPVRIGLHTAEANRRGADYSGKGVHVAARVAALAVGGQILATAETHRRGKATCRSATPGW